MTKKHETSEPVEVKELVTETYVYPDGSARVGVAPFPKLSPKEEEAKQARAE